MKYCFGCQRKKQVKDFAKNKNKPSGLQSYCKSCKSKQDHKYYLNNKITHLKRVKKYILINKKKLWSYLENHPCVDCGEKNPIVLEFDHLKNKVITISDMIRRKYSWNGIMLEIEKCVVRCANCHRIKTAKQLGWYQFVTEEV